MSLVAEPLTDVLITPEELLRRPAETGLAIDPDNPYEIDDAVSVERGRPGSELVRIKIHVADAGLLLGNPVVDQARTAGWSEYYADNTADLMLPASLALQGLSLNVNHHGQGSPAVTTAFTFHAMKRRISDIDIYKSRLDCRTTSYDDFYRRVHHNEPEARVLYKRARQLNAPLGRTRQFPEGVAKGVVGEFMLAANRIVATHMQAEGLPWLFRNHHLAELRVPNGDLIRRLYPHSELFAAHNLAWYGRIATRHQGLDTPTYCHFTSPLRRFADLVNHLNLHAAMIGEAVPYDESAIDEIANELADKIKASAIGRTALTSARQ